MSRVRRRSCQLSKLGLEQNVWLCVNVDIFISVSENNAIIVWFRSLKTKLGCDELLQKGYFEKLSGLICVLQ
jgi:hypothetical protein